MDRFVRQALIDQGDEAWNAAVIPSAAIIAALHWARQVGGDVAVGRWLPEIQKHLAGDDASIASAHALTLCLALKAGDRMAVMKVLGEVLGRSTHPLTAFTCLRAYERQLSKKQPGQTKMLNLTVFLKARSRIVALEAARVVLGHPDGAFQELIPDALQIIRAALITSDAGVACGVTVGALRVIAKCLAGSTESSAAAMFIPLNAALEALVSHECPAVSSMAIGCLLRTGSDASIDGLLGKLTTSTSSHGKGALSDEFRAGIVDAVLRLCRKFPARVPEMLDFLGKGLRDDGGIEYKKASMQAIFELARVNNGNNLHRAIVHVCEFIEDCEWEDVSMRGIAWLSQTVTSFVQQGGVDPALTTRSLSLVARALASRLILEESFGVRAVAVDGLLKMALRLTLHAPLYESIQRALLEHLEKRSAAIDEEDTAIYTRARLGLSLLRSVGAERALDWLFPRDVPDLTTVDCNHEVSLEDLKWIAIQESPTTIHQKEFKFNEAVQEESEVVFDENEAKGEAFVQDEQLLAEFAKEHLNNNFGQNGVEWTRDPEFISLNEPDSECLVNVKKHFFPTNTFILHFKVCNNASPDFTFGNVRLDCHSSEVFMQNSSPIIDSLTYGDCKSFFIVVSFKDDVGKNHYPRAGIAVSVRFTVNNGTLEQYPIENIIEIGLKDFVRPMQDLERNKKFLQTFIEETFSLTAVSTMGEASKELKKLLGGRVVEEDINTSEHRLVIAGTLYPDENFVTNCILRKNTSSVSLEITIESSSQFVAEEILNLIA